MKRLLLIILAMLLASCAPVISEEVRSKADTRVDTAQLFSNPDAYWGKTVILGGVIVSSGNIKEGTRIEVLQKPLNYRDIPEESDTSLGRFLLIYDGYLDPAIYSSGRYITVAGKVAGTQTGTLGEMQYRYLLIQSVELHLIKSGGSSHIPVFFEFGVFKGF